MPVRGLHVRSSTARGQSVESGHLHTHRLRLVHTPEQDSASDSSSVLPVEFLEAVKLRASADRLTQTGTEYNRKVSSEAAVSLGRSDCVSATRQMRTLPQRHYRPRQTRPSIGKLTSGGTFCCGKARLLSCRNQASPSRDGPRSPESLTRRDTMSRCV
jgi:hypothetical protein